jgi:predicted  nucleic acid-binding Zn-ribbon protein
MQEKAFLESIAVKASAQEKPSGFAIASDSYKLRIIELEEETVIANKRVTSLTDRVHMLEAEIRAAHDHHTRHNATLQEKLANVETTNAVLKNALEGKKKKSKELKAKLELADFALQQRDEDGEGQDENAEQGGKEGGEKGTKEKDKEPKLPGSTSSGKFTTLTPAIIKSLGLVQNQDKAVESALHQRVQILEAELSAKTNDLAVLKLLSSTLEPQVKTLTQELTKAKQDAMENGEQVSDVVEILGEWQTALEAHDMELHEHLADESELPTDEEIRRLNKKVSSSTLSFYG